MDFEPPEEFGQALVLLALLIFTLSALAYGTLDYLEMYDETSIDWEQSGFHLVP